MKKEEEKRGKKLHAELKPYGFVFEMDEPLKIPENTLEKLLQQEVKQTYHTSKKPENWSFRAHVV